MQNLHCSGYRHRRWQRDGECYVSLPPTRLPRPIIRAKKRSVMIGTVLLLRHILSMIFYYGMSNPEPPSNPLGNLRCLGRRKTNKHTLKGHRLFTGHTTSHIDSSNPEALVLLSRSGRSMQLECPTACSLPRPMSFAPCQDPICGDTIDIGPDPGASLRREKTAVS